MNTHFNSLLITIVLISFFTYPAVSISPNTLVNNDAKHSISPFNQDFITYLEELKNSKIDLNQGASSPLGYVPPTIDLSYLRGLQLDAPTDVTLFENERSILLETLSTPYYSTVITSGSPHGSHFDLITEGRVTSAKDQGTCGSCWAFSTLASLESTLLPGTFWDFSENNMKNTHGFDLSPCQGGNAFMSTAYLSRWSGPIPDASDPYSGNQLSSSTILVPNPSAVCHVQEVFFVPGRSSSTDNQNIKKMLKDYGAVYSSVHWEDARYRPSTTAYYYSGSSPPNHAITIVGWDDDYDKNQFVSTPPGNGAFIVKNSWGSKWGKDGFFYVSYYDAQIGKDNAVFIGESSTNYYHIYQYDPLGWIASYEEVGDTAYFANVFTAQDEEDVTAVAFYTPTLNSQYKISVYKGIRDVPVSGAAFATESGTITIPGYHTVSLSQPVRVKKGEKFSVVVKLTTPGYDYPVAIEYPYPGFSSHASARSGESFISSTGVMWTDLTTEYPNSNVCLKAFTTKPGESISAQPTVVPTSAPSVGDSTPPSVTVTSPGSYATVFPGQNLIVTWSATDNQGIDAVTIQYSINGGNSWNLIAEKQQKSGTYSWAVPNTVATSLSIRVTARDTSGNEASQTRVCFIRVNQRIPSLTPTPSPTPSPTPTPPPSEGDRSLPSVTVTSPGSYTTVSPGQNLIVTWSATDNQGIDAVIIQYSINGGNSWNLIAEKKQKSGTYSWTVPNTVTASFSIKVTARDTSGNEASLTRVCFVKSIVYQSTIGESVKPAPKNIESVSDLKKSLLSELAKGP